MGSDGLFLGRQEEILLRPNELKMRRNLERDVPLQSDLLLVEILSPRLGQGEPGTIQSQLVPVACEKPVDGRCVCGEFVIFRRNVWVHEGVPEGDF